VANTWWYALDNQKQGPVEIRELERLLRSNSISGKTLVWQAPMPQWIALERVPQLRSIVPTAAMAPAAVDPVVVPSAAPSAPPMAPAAAPVRPAAQPYAPPMAAAQVHLSSGDDRATYGGFWRRAAAQMLDAMVVGIPLAIIIGVLIGLFAMIGVGAASGDNANMFAALAGGGMLLVQLGFFLVMWIYFAKSESGPKQSTIGKRLVGLYVESADTSQRISFGRASGRFFGKIVSQIILYIGYIMVAFTGRRQALHDMLAGTVVRRRLEVSGTGWMVFGLGIWLVVPVLAIMAAIAIPAYSDYTARAKVAEAMAYGQQAGRSVGEYAAQQESLPDSLEAAGFNLSPPAVVSDVSYDSSNGEVSLTLNAAPISGSTLVIAPLQGADGTVQLKCSSPDIAPRYLPASCR